MIEVLDQLEIASSEDLKSLIAEYELAIQTVSETEKKQYEHRYYVIVLARMSNLWGELHQTEVILNDIAQTT
jgi:hypothetical protein